MKTVWCFNKTYRDTVLADFFSNFSTTFQIEGDVIADNKMNRVCKVDIDGESYYVKSYYKSGRKLHKYMGTSRVRREYNNLSLFKKLGIAVPEVIAFGQGPRCGKHRPGVLVTKGVNNSVDLASLAEQRAEQLQDPHWVRKVMAQVADYTYRLHQAKFIHNDLKWRNILVTLDAEPKVYFIDCPSGKRRWGLLFNRGVKKDLACLDKVAKYVLSKTMRLAFYKQYQHIKRLRAEDKATIKYITAFFAGRE